MSNRGIPTLYANVRFRSRLEARWAVMFDLLKWPWVYEPTDLEWYIPDFVLRFDAGLIAVEVKPEMTLPALGGYAQRMVSSGWSDELLVVGAAIFSGDRIGTHGESVGASEVALGDGRVFRCINCGNVSLLNEENSWSCRFSGCGEGNEHVAHLDAGELDRLWAEAGNRVQWRAA